MKAETNLSPIVLVSYGAAHVASLAPVAQALLERGRRILFLALTTASIYLDRLGLPYIGYQNLPGALDKRVQEWGRELASDLPDGGVIPLEETIAYLGLNYQELIVTLGYERAKNLYKDKGRQAFLPVNLFQRWLIQERPALVIATSSPRSERAVLEAARNLGIPSICVAGASGVQEIDWIGQPNYASYICVLNEHIKETLIRLGCRQKNLLVTGNPAFDRLQSRIVREEGCALRRSKGWKMGEIIILWASHPVPLRHPFTDAIGDPTLPNKVEMRLRKFVEQQPNFRLIVRYHPSEQDVSFQYGQDRVEPSIGSDDLAVLLNAVDIVVTFIGSVVSLEANLAGKPVIAIRKYNVIEEEKNMAATTILALSDSIEDVLLAWSKNMPKIISYNLLSDKFSTQKIIDVVDLILEEKLKRVCTDEQGS